MEELTGVMLVYQTGGDLLSDYRMCKDGKNQIDGKIFLLEGHSLCIQQTYLEK